MHFKRQSLGKSVSESNDSSTAEKSILSFYSYRASSSVQRPDKTALTAQFHDNISFVIKIPIFLFFFYHLFIFLLLYLRPY